MKKKKKNVLSSIYTFPLGTFKIHLCSVRGRASRGSVAKNLKIRFSDMKQDKFLHRHIFERVNRFIRVLHGCFLSS